MSSDSAAEDALPVAARSLAEQFAGLPLGIQGALFHVLDLVIGMSHDEKALTQQALSRLSHTPMPDLFEKTVGLLQATSGLVWRCDGIAEGHDDPWATDKEAETA